MAGQSEFENTIELIEEMENDIGEKPDAYTSVDLNQADTRNRAVMLPASRHSTMPSRGNTGKTKSRHGRNKLTLS